MSKIESNPKIIGEIAIMTGLVNIGPEAVVKFLDELRKFENISRERRKQRLENLQEINSGKQMQPAQ